MAAKWGTNVSVGLAVTAVSALGMSGVAVAHDKGSGTQTYRADLKPVPHAAMADRGSDVSGEAKIVRRGDDVRVYIDGDRLSPGLPHAMHIHGKDHREVAHCPGANHRDDLVDDGLIETVEGLKDYGGIQVSLTTSGDTSPQSGLALDRFAIAESDGDLDYSRSFSVPTDVARHLKDKHIVIHGSDLDGDGQYGGRTTALGAPLEAELPVACGDLSRTR
jgi:hypothetical protein